jgi:aspartate dehydrogenase
MKNSVAFGLIGCGAMGKTIADAIDAEKVPGRLAFVFDVDTERAKTFATNLKTRPIVAKTAAELIGGSDFVIEAASQDAVKSYAIEAVSAGKSLLIMSVGALLDRAFMDKLTTAAGKTWSRVYLPSGAVAGIDGLLSAASIGIEEVTLTSTKPPAGLKDVKYIKDAGIDLEHLSGPTVVYEGTASEAVSLFPKNINVSAIVSLASAKNIKVKIVADPAAKTNIHEIYAKGGFGELTTRTSNVPSPTNPKTSYLAALSAIATLKKVTGNIRIGN